MKCVATFPHKFDVLSGVRYWLNSLDIQNPKLAQLICHLIPGRCPFERRIQFLGYLIVIPPLCHLNPLYPQLMTLRLKALTYLSHHPDADRIDL